MAMSYDSSLVAGADVANLLGVPSLANLAASGEITLDTLLLNAHRWVYARLEGKGVDPTKLTNESRLKVAVASRAMELVCGSGGFQGTAGPVDAGSRDYWGRQAREDVDLFARIAQFSPAAATPSAPSVGHVDGGLVFSGDFPEPDLDFFSTATPNES